jgi:hypothetical protein
MKLRFADLVVEIKVFLLPRPSLVRLEDQNRRSPNGPIDIIEQSINLRVLQLHPKSCKNRLR